MTFLEFDVWQWQNYLNILIYAIDFQQTSLMHEMYYSSLQFFHIKNSEEKFDDTSSIDTLPNLRKLLISK